MSNYLLAPEQQDRLFNALNRYFYWCFAHDGALPFEITNCDLQFTSTYAPLVLMPVLGVSLECAVREHILVRAGNSVGRDPTFNSTRPAQLSRPPRHAMLEAL